MGTSQREDVGTIKDALAELSHARSAPAAYLTAFQLLASGAASDPNDGTATAGNGAPIAVPTWANTATFFIGYTLAGGGDAAVNSAAVDVFIAPSVPGTLQALVGVGAGGIKTTGRIFVVSDIGGAASIGAAASEDGDATKPGKVTVNIVFSRS